MNVLGVHEKRCQENRTTNDKVTQCEDENSLGYPRGPVSPALLCLKHECFSFLLRSGALGIPRQYPNLISLFQGIESVARGAIETGLNI